MRKFYIIFYKSFVFSIVFLIACQTKTPSIENSLVTNELLETTAYLKNRAENKIIFHQETCADFTSSIREQLYVRSPEFYLPKNEAESQYLIQNYRSLVHALFQLRLLILEKYQSFNSPTFQCLENTQKAVLAIRHAEDQLLLWLLSKNAIVNPDSSFAQLDFPNVVWPEKFQSYAISAGDIFLLASQNPILENMTRVFSSDESFDHIGLIVQDTKAQKYLLEMHPETGLQMHEVSILNQKNYKRIAVFRMKNSKTAQIAAQAGYLHFERLLRQQSLPQYDLSYAEKDEHKLINTKVVQKSFDFAVQGMFQVPSRQSMYIDIEKTKLLDMMEIRTRRVFLPIDIEFDKKFEQVAEFRKISELEQILQHETATASFFHWVAAQKYQFRRSYPNPNTYLQKYYLIRNVVKKNIADIMKRKNSKTPFTYRQRLEIADEYRATDCLRLIHHEEALKYNSQKSFDPPIFHDIFSSDICSPKMKMNDSVL